MGIVLFRVDERLIHGQVVVGWGSQLHPDQIVVVDDEIAGSDWEQELYGIGLPGEIAVQFLGVDAARVALPKLRDAPARTMILTRDVTTMRRLAEGGTLRDVEVNIGGIHYAAGRDRVLPYVYLSDAERSELRQLANAGALVSARDLPGAHRVPLAGLLGAG